MAFQSQMLFGQTTVWMGNIRPHMDETYMNALLMGEPDLMQVKVIRDKTSSLIASYCFLEFHTHDGARRFIERNNGQPLPNGDGVFRLNWAQVPGSATPKYSMNTGPEYSMFVGDLTSEVSEDMLFQACAQFYPHSISSVKIVIEFGRTFNFGFVKFTNDADRHGCIARMQGYLLGGRPLKVNVAVQRPNEAVAALEPGGLAANLRPQSHLPRGPPLKKRKTEQASALELGLEMQELAQQYLQLDVPPAPGMEGWDFLPPSVEFLTIGDVEADNELFVRRRLRLLAEADQPLSRAAFGLTQGAT